MKLTVTLERGDAALGTIDFDLLREAAEKAFEEAAAWTIYNQMPDRYCDAGRTELFGSPGHEYPRDFEESALATIRWMLRRFRIMAPGIELPSPDDLGKSETLSWPREGAK